MPIQDGCGARRPDLPQRALVAHLACDRGQCGDVLIAGAGWNEQQKDEIDRLAVDCVEVDRAGEPDE